MFVDDLFSVHIIIFVSDQYQEITIWELKFASIYLWCSFAVLSYAVHGHGGASCSEFQRSHDEQVIERYFLFDRDFHFFRKIFGPFKTSFCRREHAGILLSSLNEFNPPRAKGKYTIDLNKVPSSIYCPAEPFRCAGQIQSIGTDFRGIQKKTRLRNC